MKEKWDSSQIDWTKTNEQIARETGRSTDSIRSKRGRFRREGLNVPKSPEAPVTPKPSADWDHVTAKMIEALKSREVFPEQIGVIKAIKSSVWTTTIKNAEGEAETHENYGVQLQIDPAVINGPAWPVVDRAPKYHKDLPIASPCLKKLRTAIILPDPQIGYRRVGASLDPFHCEKSMSVALSIAKDLNPDLIVNLGDFIDLPEFSKYMQEPAFALTTQAAIDRGYEFLCHQKEVAPNAHIALIGGNHEIRLQKFIITNAKAAFGLSRAKTPDNWPVLSVPYLLRTDELGVEYISGYPASEFWINDNLKCVHGSKVRSGGSTATAVCIDERVSTIFGHIHRIEAHYKTVNVRGGFKTRLAMSPGCLSRIDGAVPSTNSGLDEYGKSTTRYENWQNGIAVVQYEDGDGIFSVTPVHIHSGIAIYNGKEYRA
jgi:hypothetical protein